MRIRGDVLHNFHTITWPKLCLPCAQHTNVLVAESTRRQADAVSIAQGRSTWEDDLPVPHSNHELTESQMNFLLRVNPEVGLLGGAERFLVMQFVAGVPRFIDTPDGATEHPAASIQKNLDKFKSAPSATRAIIIGVHPVTETGGPGWGHWVAFCANKCNGESEYILLDSDNHPLLSFRDRSILAAYTGEEGLRARLRDELQAIDMLVQCCEGKVRSMVARPGSSRLAWLCVCSGGSSCAYC